MHVFLCVHETPTRLMKSIHNRGNILNILRGSVSSLTARLIHIRKSQGKSCFLSMLYEQILFGLQLIFKLQANKLSWLN